jgi:glycine/D-amino acid oxidase-like deaminating enzyme
VNGRHPDAIVIGAGIVGAAVADALAADGLRVTVLEAATAASGATAAGMGHLVAMDDSPAQLALTAYSLRCWRELLPGLSAQCEHDPAGTLWVAEEGTNPAMLAEKCRGLTAAGVDAEVLDAHQVHAAEPQLRSGLGGGLRVPGDGVLYAPAVTRYLLQRARGRGCEVREGASVAAVGSRTVRVGGETLSANVVVNAAGAGAARITPGLPIVPRKGHLAITDRAPCFCRHQIVELGYLASAHDLTAPSVAFNVQPRATGQVLIGSSRELVGWEASLNRAIAARMLRRAVTFMPGLADLPVTRTWTGFRPATPDGLPLIGRWGAVDGLWIAAGHEGLGITTALGTARLIADAVAGRPPAIDPRPYDPARAHA